MSKLTILTIQFFLCKKLLHDDSEIKYIFTSPFALRHVLLLL